MSDSGKTKTFCEFFAGIGLVHEGLRPGQWECVYANDIEPKKHQMYEGHFGITPYYHVGDVWKTQTILDRISGAPFLATASFPCVDLSLAGHWRGFAGEHSSTYFGFLEVLRGMGERRPKIVMLENVYGFLTSHEGKDFEQAVQELAALGYWIDAIVLDARWFVPQSRPRMFVFGFHESIKNSLILADKRFTLDDPWNAALERTRVLRTETLLGSMRRIGLPTGWATLDFAPPERVARPLETFIDLDASQQWWDQYETQKHYDMMEAPSKARVDDLMSRGATAVGAAFRRTRRGKTRTEVRFDVAGCLRTPKGGSAKQIIVAVVRGDLRMRWMSPREYARLQGAGEFRITVPPIQAMHGFGDAVCVPAISWIDRAILTPLFETSTLSHVAA